MTTALAMVTIDCADPKELARFWTDALGTSIAQDVDGEYLVLAPATEGGVALGLQRVPEPKAGKNRVHLDLSTPDRPAAVARLVGLGATVVEEHVHAGFAWTVLLDPAGNEFCVGGPHQ